MGYKLYTSAEYQRRRYYSGGWQKRIAEQSLATYHNTKIERENRPSKIDGFNNLFNIKSKVVN
tara:strand:+ start:1895 stop:2083 length:189 start_codon:yes stop_codon:yes gene_type:complete